MIHLLHAWMENHPQIFVYQLLEFLHSNLEQAQTQLGPYKDLYLCDSQCMPLST